MTRRESRVAESPAEGREHKRDCSALLVQICYLSRRWVNGRQEADELLTGTIVKQYVRCGHRGCHCRTGRGHGPYYYLSYRDRQGRQHKRYLPRSQVRSWYARLRWVRARYLQRRCSLEDIKREARLLCQGARLLKAGMRMRDQDPQQALEMIQRARALTSETESSMVQTLARALEPPSWRWLHRGRRRLRRKKPQAPRG